MLTEASTAPEAQITGLRIDGLSVTGCAEAVPVTVTIKGTPSGDPAGKPTETLTVLDSTLDPCTGQRLTDPLVIRHGQITLTACPTGGRSGYADVHDATRLILRVAGQRVTVGDDGPGGAVGAHPGSAVLGEKLTRNDDRRQLNDERSEASVIAALPFTGGWVGMIFWLGALALLGGVVLVLVVRARHRRPHTT